MADKDYGNRDGLLQYDILRIDVPSLCDAIERCALDKVGDEVMRVVSRGCGGNIATRVPRIHVVLNERVLLVA